MSMSLGPLTFGLPELWQLSISESVVPEFTALQTLMINLLGFPFGVSGMPDILRKLRLLYWSSDSCRVSRSVTCFSRAMLEFLRITFFPSCEVIRALSPTISLMELSNNADVPVPITQSISDYDVIRWQ